MVLPSADVGLHCTPCPQVIYHAFGSIVPAEESSSSVVSCVGWYMVVYVLLENLVSFPLAPVLRNYG